MPANNIFLSVSILYAYMKPNYTILLAVLSIVFVSGCTQYEGQQNQSTTPTKPTPTTKQTVEITPSGFSPNTLTINAGDTVTFVNKDSTLHWPASAVHPTHTVYPESGGCIGSKFDACKGLAQGETFSFTFNQKGAWKYHDHLNPGLTGTIVVQ